MNKNIIYIIGACLIGACLVFVGFDNYNMSPEKVYRVYLEGYSIGLTKSKDELENYINQEQLALKEKYNVDKIYIPEDLDIEEELTYNEEIYSAATIYEKIKDIKPFTIKGYEIIIKGIEEKIDEETTTISPTETIYVINKEIFATSVDKTIRSFIDSDQYDKFLSDNQTVITDVGDIIEDLYIQNEILIREKNISVDQKIFTTEEELSKYLLFGTTEEQKTYIVKEGDTIEDVAFNNKISTQEFLIANTGFRDKNSLLFNGQKVVLGILKPKFETIVEKHVVENQEQKYSTETVYTDDLIVGEQRVKQEGQNGLYKITKKVKLSNGQILSSIVTEKDEIKPVINEIIELGGRKVNWYAIVGDPGNWAWPTVSPYTINSEYGWRWGELHDGVDIGGYHGSPIKAAQGGVVVDVNYRWPDGNYVTINHNNGYYSHYAHLSAIYSRIGDAVPVGTVIGAMGSTGFSTGTHLHFAIWYGAPYSDGAVSYDPLRFY